MRGPNTFTPPAELAPFYNAGRELAQDEIRRGAERGADEQVANDIMTRVSEGSHEPPDGLVDRGMYDAAADYISELLQQENYRGAMEAERDGGYSHAAQYIHGDPERAHELRELFAEHGPEDEWDRGQLHAARDVLAEHPLWEQGYASAWEELTADPNRLERLQGATSDPDTHADLHAGRQAAAREFDATTRVTLTAPLDVDAFPSRDEFVEAVHAAIREAYPEAGETSLATFQHDTDGQSVSVHGRVYELAGQQDPGLGFRDDHFGECLSQARERVSQHTPGER